MPHLSILSTRLRIVFALLPAVLVVACGGGGDASQISSSVSYADTTGSAALLATTSLAADSGLASTAAIDGIGSTATKTSAHSTTSTTVPDAGSTTAGADSGTLAALTVFNRARPALPIPLPMVGVTTDSISNVSAIVASLNSIKKVPTTRIVFDENVPSSEYRDATVKIRNVSYVMGEILDSFYVRTLSVQGYLNRTKDYLNTLGDVVDIWEVGNEINGEWLGKNSDVVAKMSGAYDLVKSQGKTAELTLYYNKGCFDKPANEMFAWAKANIPERMKTGLDYVLVSYYEDDCNGLQPDWPAVFKQLATLFPNSKIGFGEVGTTKSARKAEYITRYYSKKISVPNYVGGYFWWYFKQDMVPNTKTPLSTLNSAISTQ
jgi:hypothetical protein